MRTALLAFGLLSASAIARPFTPGDLVSLARVSAPVVSPDGRWLVWQQRETDLAANKGRKDLWRLDLGRAGAKPEPLAAKPLVDESDPAFGPDGTLYFLSDETGHGEVWSVAPAGGAARQVTSGGDDLDGFAVNPRGDKLVVWAKRAPGAFSLQRPLEKPNQPGGSGRTYDQLFVRHWDEWADGARSQLFVLPLSNGAAPGHGVAIEGGLVGDTPSQPFGDGSEISWAPDGRTVYFALREAGRIEPLSTNLDIFAAPADGSSAPMDLTKDNQATDTHPAVSPDGKWLAWTAMKRPGYESDQLVIHMRELATGETRVLADDWDVSIEDLKWSRDSKSLLVAAHDNFDKPLFRVDIATSRHERLTKDGTVSAFDPLPSGGAIVALDTLTAPDDLYRVDARGRMTRLTSANAQRLAGIEMPTAARFSYAGANGDTVWGYALKPAGLASGEKVPVAYLVHGGPQGSWGNGWSYRWNPAIYASAGYAAVLVDFHGSTGHGQPFTDSINQDWGGKPLVDLKLGLAATAKQFPWADTTNACALGASYGGYMMNWIEGNWPDGFKCIVQHDGVFDSRAMAYETEELWFDEWEHGGHPYYEAPVAFEKWNPVNYVAQWKTPQLVITSEKDFRIPYTQGIAAFTALQRRNIPSRLLVFPDESHWVQKPRNSLQWHREVLGWLDKWLRPVAPR